MSVKVVAMRMGMTVVAVIVMLAAWSYGSTMTPREGEEVYAEMSSLPDGIPSAETTQEELDLLPVKGRAPMTGYSREAFGQAWSDDVEVEGGHNGCDTRNDILRRDLAEVVLKPGTHGCVVALGVLHDPYSGRSIDFVRGVDTSRVVQIDHVVALADAWVKGAQQMYEVTRRNLANDPLNLMAVDGGLNAQKGAGDAATWLPPNVGFRCDYARRQVAVKQRYGLWVTQAEKDALRGILVRC